MLRMENKDVIRMVLECGKRIFGKLVAVWRKLLIDPLVVWYLVVTVQGEQDCRMLYV